MREIKFRAWDKEKKLMYRGGINSLNLTDDNGVVSASLLQKDYTVEPHFLNTDIELLQYTGLKDKNGKEIYEGDIANVDGIKDPHLVEFVQKDSGGRFQFTHPKKGVWSCFPKPIIEVIGNIYENPELLATH